MLLSAISATDLVNPNRMESTEQVQ